MKALTPLLGVGLTAIAGATARDPSTPTTVATNPENGWAGTPLCNLDHPCETGHVIGESTPAPALGEIGPLPREEMATAVTTAGNYAGAVAAEGGPTTLLTKATPTFSTATPPTKTFSMPEEQSQSKIIAIFRRGWWDERKCKTWACIWVDSKKGNGRR